MGDLRICQIWMIAISTLSKQKQRFSKESQIIELTVIENTRVLQRKREIGIHTIAVTFIINALQKIIKNDLKYKSIQDLF